MEIKKIEENKRDYMPLLLLGDEQESMVERYLDRGDLFALFDGGLRAVCVVTREGEGVYELKNLAVDTPFQRRGLGRMLVEFVWERYQPQCRTLLVGTGDSPLTLPFYQACGFVFSHRVANFFLEHYDHPIFEGGRQLVDMVYLKRTAPAGRRKPPGREGRRPLPEKRDYAAGR